MKKKVLSLVLAAAMTVTMMAGCGKATSEPAAAEPAATTEEVAPVEAPAAEAPADTAEASDELIVVGYAQVGAESDWRTANTESFKSTFTEENGYQLIFDDAQQKQENQIKAIRSFIQQEVDYIVVAPVVETGWETVLEEAKEAGIPVILSDRMMDLSDDSLYECWVGGNFVKEGEDAAAWLKTYLEGEEEVNIVTLQGTIGASAQVGRTEGFANGMQDNWVMLDKQTGEFTQSKGQEVMESFLKQYPDINVVVCENDNMAFGAIDAIKAAGKTCGPEGDIVVMSFDAVAAAFDSMIAGDLNATFECNPLHGPRVAEIIQKLEAGESVEKIQYVDESFFDTSMDVEAIKATRAY